jgi:hypothetical protein
MSEVNILFDILKELQQAHSTSTFVNSLYQQYCERGGLSKKQLEGLYNKAVKAESLSHGKLATLEAIIKKKPTRERAPATKQIVTPIIDIATGEMLQEILVKYPQHKRILFLRSRYDNNEHLTPAEIDEVKKLHKLLIK